MCIYIHIYIFTPAPPHTGPFVKRDLHKKTQIVKRDLQKRPTPTYSRVWNQCLSRYLFLRFLLLMCTVYLNMHVYIYIYKCVYAYVYVSIYGVAGTAPPSAACWWCALCIYIYMYIYIYVCKCACMYVCMYMYTLYR